MVARDAMAVATLEGIEDTKLASLGRLLHEKAVETPDKTLVVWGDEKHSYRQIDERASALAGALYGLGVRCGRRVGVLMANHPDYLALVAALSRLNAIAALFDDHLRGDSLAHVIRTAAPDLVVVDDAHAKNPRGREIGVEFYTVEHLMQRAAASLPDDLAPNPGRCADVALLLFTSGTTGLPKAVKIPNRRILTGALAAAELCELTTEDTVYCSIPLHHSMGIAIASASTIATGATIALMPRFDATRFWDDVRRTGSTVVFYSGDLCHDLVSQPDRAGESEHGVRLFIGSGMKRDVWHRLLARFGPTRVLEYYGQTEGNVIIANLTGEKVGSVGRDLSGESMTALVRVDHETGRPRVDARGRLVRSDEDEPGVLLARVEASDPIAHFEGYLDRAATEEKLIRDAFEPGDTWYVTGDLFRRDGDGDYWFLDRLGDTFRWNGKNVSAHEVEAVLSRDLGVLTAAVYGVLVPGRSGRAAMAAIQLAEGATLDGDALFACVGAHLIPEARPRAIRVVDSFERTATLKIKKSNLRSDGLTTSSEDPIYVYDDARLTYRRSTGTDVLSSLSSPTPMSSPEAKP